MQKTDSSNDQTLGASIERAASQPLTLMYFSAQWCGPCQQMAPIVNAASEIYRDEIHVVKIDVDSNPELATEFQVRGVPTLTLMANNEVIDRRVGAASFATLAQWLDQHLTPNTAT